MRLRLALLPILLSACQDRDVPAAPSPTPNHTHNAVTGETLTLLPVAEGVAVLRSGATVPVVLPRGLTIYPGAKVVRTTHIERGCERRTLVEYATPDPIAKVLLFHRPQAAAAGVALTLDLAGTEGASIGGRLPSGGDFALTVRRDAGDTQVQLSVSDPASAARSSRPNPRALPACQPSRR